MGVPVRGPTLKFHCPNEDCEEEHEVETEAELDDPSYGSDADGNRGIFVAGGITDWYAPEKCSKCGTVFTKEQADEIHKELKGAADAWEPFEDDPDDSR